MYTIKDLQKMCKKHNAGIQIRYRPEKAEMTIEIDHETCSVSFYDESHNLEELVDYTAEEFYTKLSDEGLEDY